MRYSSFLTLQFCLSSVVAFGTIPGGKGGGDEPCQDLPPSEIASAVASARAIRCGAGDTLKKCTATITDCSDVVAAGLCSEAAAKEACCACRNARVPEKMTYKGGGGGGGGSCYTDTCEDKCYAPKYDSKCNDPDCKCHDDTCAEAGEYPPNGWCYIEDISKCSDAIMGIYGKAWSVQACTEKPLQWQGEDPFIKIDGVCDNTCSYPGDGDCDDGGPGAQYSACDPGTDCHDCAAGGDWGMANRRYTLDYGQYLAGCSVDCFPSGDITYVSTGMFDGNWEPTWAEKCLEPRCALCSACHDGRVEARNKCTAECNAAGYCCTSDRIGPCKTLTCTGGCHLAFFEGTEQACKVACYAAAAEPWQTGESWGPHEKHFMFWHEKSDTMFEGGPIMDSDMCGCAPGESWNNDVGTCLYPDGDYVDACVKGCEIASTLDPNYGFYGASRTNLVSDAKNEALRVMNRCETPWIERCTWEECSSCHACKNTESNLVLTDLKIVAVPCPFGSCDGPLTPPKPTNGGDALVSSPPPDPDVVREGLADLSGFCCDGEPSCEWEATTVFPDHTINGDLNDGTYKTLDNSNSDSKQIKVVLCQKFEYLDHSQDICTPEPDGWPSNSATSETKLGVDNAPSPPPPAPPLPPLAPCTELSYWNQLNAKHSIVDVFVAYAGPPTKGADDLVSSDYAAADCPAGTSEVAGSDLLGGSYIDRDKFNACYPNFADCSPTPVFRSGPKLCKKKGVSTDGWKVKRVHLSDTDECPLGYKLASTFGGADGDLNQGANEASRTPKEIYLCLELRCRDVPPEDVDGKFNTGIAGYQLYDAEQNKCIDPPSDTECKKKTASGTPRARDCAWYEHFAAKTLNEKTLGLLKPPCVSGTAGENEHWHPDTKGDCIDHLQGAETCLGAAVNKYWGWMEVPTGAEGGDTYSAGKKGYYRRKPLKKLEAVKQG